MANISNVERQTRIRAELAGKDAELGKPLSLVEQETLRALSIVGPYPLAVAKVLYTHVNTIDVRIRKIRRKYGLPKGAHTTWRIMCEGLRRGDVKIGT